LYAAIIEFYPPDFKLKIGNLKLKIDLLAAVINEPTDFASQLFAVHNHVDKAVLQ